ncbi:MAG TPA: hypothetical protein DCM87_05350 [Planctomycetes bacterium]|nr:hypothetical protein [Planctomycetota bacterium]
MRLDDPWNGAWVRIATAPVKQGAVWRVAFPPLSKEEWEQAGDHRVTFRCTLKLRVVDIENAPLPRELRLRAFGKAVWAQDRFDIEHKLAADGGITARIEVANGVVAAIESLPPPRGARVEGAVWTAHGVAGNSAGVRVRLFYADLDDLDSNDLTCATIRLGAAPDATGFSFVPQAVRVEGALWVPDFGTLVAPADRAMSWARSPAPPAGQPGRVRQRIAGRAEATRASAMAGIPRLAPPRDIPIGVPACRQEFFVSPEGDWSIDALSLNTDNGTDAARWAFASGFGNARLRDSLRASLDTRERPEFDGKDREEASRSLEDGHLPRIIVTWRNGDLRYRHELCATALLGDYGDDASRRGDETVVLLTKLTVTNWAEERRTAFVSLRYSQGDIGLDEDGLITLALPEGRKPPEGLIAQRGMISMDELGSGPWGWSQARDDEGRPYLTWRGGLALGERRVMYFKIPFVDLLTVTERMRLSHINFEEEVPGVLAYWRARLARGTVIETPDKEINDFYKAVLWHVAITTDRDPETGLYNQGVGTVRYRVFANETVMIARAMDMRNEPVEAERFLEPMLRYQGREPLKGRFSTAEGVFHSAGEYTHGEYAMNHGFVLWGIADHYLVTRDRAHLERAAPQLVKGCDFLIAERRSTMGAPDAPRPPIHGLAPASSLEDVVEYQYWFATNAYFHLGMKRAAQALAAIGHGEAERIAREAEAYRHDIERAAREAATRAATTTLRDGTSIPYVPSRVFQRRHLTEGWIREALYPALHLATGEVVAPHDPLVTWMLDDLEDRIFFSRQSGYNVADHETAWFERGGVTLQPCLLDTPIVYMARDEVEAALRAFWNSYALLIYPDARCLAEWAPAFGRGGGPLYKTSDEARFAMWLRQLLIWEDGDTLRLCRGMPREWLRGSARTAVANAPTVFGITSFRIEADADGRRIRAIVTPPARTPPRELWLRLRHPEKRLPARVFVNDARIDAARVIGEDIELLPSDAAAGGAIEVRAEY